MTGTEGPEPRFLAWDGEDPLAAAYFTVTHRPLDQPPPSFVQPVSSVPAGPGVLDVAAGHPDLAGRGPELSEYATLFALNRELMQRHERTGPPADQEMTGFGHYRRYAVVRPMGVPVDLYGMLRREEFAALSAEDLLPAPGTLVLPVVAHVGRVLQQYAAQHVGRDLLVFLATAIDLGVTDGPTVARFLDSPVMVAAPTVGVYPTGWFLETLGQLEQVATAFGADGFVEREGYQRRSTGFCLERLHALLLGQLVAGWDPARVSTQRAVVVSDDLSYSTGG